MNSVIWTKDGIAINVNSSPFSQTQPVIDKVTATSTIILSSSNISSLVGSFTCDIMDGNGRSSSSGLLQLNGMIKCYLN